ncbi:MAG: CAP domain-containing protein [Pseudomonadota bacterium]
MRALVLCLVLAACSAAPSTTVRPAASGSADALALASQARVSRGLSPLRADPRLAAAAEEQAEFMARRGKIGHDGRGGSTVLERVRAVGVEGCHMAENVAAGQRSAAQVHGDWMGSAGHRANILNSNLDSGAVASVEGNGMIWWAMVLAGPC